MTYALAASLLLNIILFIVLEWHRIQASRYKHMAKYLGERSRRLDEVVSDLRGIIKKK